MNEPYQRFNSQEQNNSTVWGAGIGALSGVGLTSATDIGSKLGVNRLRNAKINARDSLKDTLATGEFSEGELAKQKQTYSAASKRTHRVSNMRKAVFGSGLKRTAIHGAGLLGGAIAGGVIGNQQE